MTPHDLDKHDAIHGHLAEIPARSPIPLPDAVGVAARREMLALRGR